jgi:YHS domain-containing protein
MKKGTLLLAALAMFILASCSGENNQQSASSEEAELFTQHTSHTAVTSTPEIFEPEMEADGLRKDLVCMVNNAFMGKKQFPVEFGDKMYYGCCEMCVNTIQNDRKVRYAKDPLSGKEVDKSEAFIALEPGNAYGGVLYFESEDNYKEYINKL